MRANFLRGFTLVEMLLALAITSLVMTLLMGAMHYVLQVRQKLASEVYEGEVSMRTQVWFRQLVHGIVPLEANIVDTFSGDAKGFRALISPSLSATQGAAPVPVQLRIEIESDAKGVSLLYQDGTSPIVINTWPAISARFEYFTRSGKTIERWDPLEQLQERAPRAIALQLQMSDGSGTMLFAKVDAEPWAPRVAPKPFFMSGAGSGK